MRRFVFVGCFSVESVVIEDDAYRSTSSPRSFSMLTVGVWWVRWKVCTGLDFEECY